MAKKSQSFFSVEESDSSTPIAKKTTQVNIGKIYQLTEGKQIPSEIPKSFYNSFREQEII